MMKKTYFRTKFTNFPKTFMHDIVQSTIRVVSWYLMRLCAFRDLYKLQSAKEGQKNVRKKANL